VVHICVAALLLDPLETEIDIKGIIVLTKEHSDFVEVAATLSHMNVHARVTRFWSPLRVRIRALVIDDLPRPTGAQFKLRHYGDDDCAPCR
jgi:hypothetical protein